MKTGTDRNGRITFQEDFLSLVVDEKQGLEFIIAPGKCDPETRAKLMAAAVKGSRLSVAWDDESEEGGREE